MKRLNAIAIAMLLSSQLTACGGGGASGGALPAAAGGSHPQGTASIQIKIPAKSTASGNARSPQYVSASTTQLLIDVQQGGTSIAGYPQTIGLTSTSPGCTVVSGGTQCTVSLALAVGSYLANLTTEDANNNVLSTATSVPITVAASGNNPVNVTLSGTPTAFSVTTATPFIVGSQVGGFSLVGQGARGFIINALDADGNIIAGAGAPTFTVSQTSGAMQVGITQPLLTAPNAFSLSAPATLSTGTANVSIVASYGSGLTNTCASTTACTTNVAVTMQTLLAVADEMPRLTLYAASSTTPLLTITANLSAEPGPVVFDGNGNMFVANYYGVNENVLEFAPPYTGAPTIISTGVYQPESLAVDTSNNLFVGNSYGGTYNGITEYAPGTTTPSRTISLAAVGAPESMCTDPSGDLFEDTEGAPGGEINEYAPGATTPTHALTGQYFPNIVACDQSGNIFVAYYGDDLGDEIIGVTEYDSTLALVNSPSGVLGPNAMTEDPNGNLWVGNSGSSATNLIEVPHGSNSPSLTITSGLSTPKQIAVDSAENVFVADSGSVHEYLAGQTAQHAVITPSTLWTIQGLAVSP